MSDDLTGLGVGRDERDLDPRRERRRRRRPLLVLLTALVLVLGGCGAAFFALQNRYDRNLERFGDPFADIPAESRPPTAEAVDDGEPPLNYLLLGTDSRISAGDPAQWQAGSARTDVTMLVHVPSDRAGAYVMSFPRDAWVEIPGRGEAKINAAYSFGGPSLLIQTVEQLTGARIDHLGIVDFTGFVEMTDALGGVDITVPADTADADAGYPAGTQTMDGETALDYVRERYGLPGGDLDRVKRQQNWMRAVMGEALSRDTLADPLRLDRFLRATTNSMAVDDEWSIGDMRDLAVQMRGTRQGDVTFFTVPVAGLGRSADGQSIVELDDAAGAELWAAVRDDALARWVDANPDVVLGETVN